jgi:uncharacterized delta-60 repeat protein
VYPGGSGYQDYIVVAGQTGGIALPRQAPLALARYRPDGTLDPTFGNGGIVAPYEYTEGQWWYPYPSAVAIQPDGKIVVHGADSEDGSNWYSFLSRYNVDGSLDDGGEFDSTPLDQFGDAGTVITPVDGGSSVLIQPQLDGTSKIIVAGASAGCIAMARYNEDGSPDTSFGGP